MFNWSKNGTPIATCKGGINNGKILYMNTDADIKLPEQTNPLACTFCGKLYKNTNLMIKHVSKCKTKMIHDYVKKYINTSTVTIGTDNLELNDGKFEVLPNINKREVCYIAGPNGSGKSYYCASYLKHANQLLKQKDIFLISRLEKDVAFDDVKHIERIKIDNTLLTDPIPISEFEDSIVLFDDIDKSDNPKITKYLEKLRDDLIMNGRDHTDNGKDAYILITNHQITNYAATRDLLNECSSITIYPQSGSTHGITYALKNYCGLSNKQIDKILKLNSRWITLYKRYPMYCISEHNCFMLNTI